MKASDKLRTFIALKTPSDWTEDIRALQQSLRAELRNPEFKWVDPEQIHLTLRFLGNITSDQVAKVVSAIDTATAGIPLFRLNASDLGCFPSVRRPRVLWLGLEGDNSQLLGLQERVFAETRDFGDPPEERPFKPHLTLARVKSMSRSQATELEEALKRPAQVRSIWRVSELLLVQSHLSPSGSRYEILHASPLV